MTPTDLRELRTALGLSQQGLADALGLEGTHARHTVAAWEAGRSRITERTAKSVRLLWTTYHDPRNRVA